MSEYCNDEVAEGTITEEQWNEMAKWFFEGKSILFELAKKED